MPVSNACLIARAKLSRYVADLFESATPEKFTTGVKVGYLLNPKSAERNIVGNTGQLLADQAVREAAAAIDYAQSVVRSAATGGKTKPHEFRQIASGLRGGGLQYGWEGVKKGYGEFKTIMKTGVNPYQKTEKFDHPRVKYDTPALEFLQQKVFGFFEGSDRPFFEATKHISRHGRVRLAGIRAGLKGKALDDFVAYGEKNPTPDVELGANFDAMMATYKNSTQLSKLASDARRGLKQRMDKGKPGRRVGAAGALVALELTIPFTKVAGAIINAAADYSPAGFAKALLYQFDKNPALQRELTQRLLKASAGSALMYLGYIHGEAGKATGSWPSKEGERRRWDLEGKGGNQIYLWGEWRSPLIFGPLAIPYIIGANISAAEDTDAVGKAFLMAAFLGKTLTEMSFLSGVKGTVEAMTDPMGKGSNAISRLAVPLPSAVPQVAQAIDPVLRQSKGPVQKVQSRLPLASKGLPAALTVFGDTIRKPGGLRAVADPTAGRKGTETQVTQELNRLEVNPGAIGDEITIGGEKIKRTPEERNALTLEFGPIKRAWLQQIIRDPDYMRMTAEQKKDALERIIASIGRSANAVDKARRSGEAIPKYTVESFGLTQ